MGGIKVLLDAGPLVAYVSQTDQHHRWAVAMWDTLYEPLWTCEAVLSEAIFLLQSDGLSLEPLLGFMERGIVKLDFDVATQRAAVWRPLRKYADQPMSLADAWLVRMSELAGQFR